MQRTVRAGVIQAWTWASETRGTEIEQKTKRYPTDLTEEEWARIQRFLPSLAISGRPA